ncbi:MAG: SnoaL-like domain-containing protein [Bacteroidota bacterium]
MTTQEVATPFIKLLQEGKYDKAQKEFFADDIVSIEPEGVPDRIQKGINAILQKGEKFNDTVEQIHTNEVSDAIIAGNFFSCSIKSKMSFKGAPEPMMLEEIAVYHVSGDKIDREEFFYTNVPME